MRLFRCGLPALLATALAFPSHAQAGPPAAAPRVLVGLGAGYLVYQLPGRFAVRLPALVPTVGVAFAPRWSLQVSGAYTGQTNAGSYAESRFGPSGQVTNVTYHVTTSHRTWAVPVLARYALRAPTHRWQLDALGGVTLVHDVFRRAATADSADVRIGDTTASTRTVGVSLTLGLGVRYALTPRLALTGDALLSRLLNGSAAAGQVPAPGLVVGLRYGLGRRE